jgi:hypothetical protein
MRTSTLLPKAFLGAFAVCAALAVSALAKPKITGLEFPIGQPADRPAARVTIAELGQGAQKRGFFRVALLPMAAANGMQIRFLLPEPGVLLEIPQTLRGIASLDAQEFHNVTILAPNDPTPRLEVEEIVPKKDHWQLKRVKWRSASRAGEVQECHLLLSGPECGQFAHLSPAQPIPSLRELLQPVPAP